MRTICPFSRRWHQIFLQSPSFTNHIQCLRHFQPVRQYRKPNRGSIPRIRPTPAPSPFDVSRHPDRSTNQPSFPETPLVVREYEQHGHDRSTVRPEPPHPVQLEAERAKARLEQLEKELALLKQGPFGPQSPFMQSLPTDERANLLKTLEEEGVDLQDDLSFLDDGVFEADIDAVEFDGIDSPTPTVPPNKSGLRVSLRIPAQDQAYVKQFNRALRAAEERPQDLQASLAVWKWYLRCQQKVANFSMVISEDVWQFLWSSLAHFNHRPKHLIVLARDITASGGSLKPDHWVEYIQALQLEGDLLTALAVWESKNPDLGKDSSAALSFWMAGIGILAVLGRPRKAEELAFECLEYLDNFEPQIMVPVIAAWADSRDPHALDHAWACYLNLRTKMSGSLDLGVLDNISNIFLSRGQHRLALSVFKDMVVGSDNKRYDSISVWQQAVEHLENLSANNISADQINQISLNALTVFPRGFQNKFFYASWIKRLIGNGHVDAAASVVDLMYERGIRPDAKHLNGIVGAWLRSSSQRSHEKAEKMAWTMIVRRIQMVKARSSHGHAFSDSIAQTGAVTLEDSDSMPRHIDLRRPTPAANLETFSLLLMYLTTRSSFDRAEHLMQIMTTQAGLRPNSFILNHWLYSSLRQGDIGSLWTRYNDFKREINLDLETFAALWDAAKVNYDRARSAYSPDFPSPRHLFSEMQSWLSQLPDHKLDTTREEFSRDLYEQIIRCFCLSGDLCGLIGALHGMSREFGMLPHEDVGQMVVFKAAQLAIPANEGSPKISIRRRKNKQQLLHRELMDSFVSIMDNLAVKALNQDKAVGDSPPVSTLSSSLLDSPDEETDDHIDISALEGESTTNHPTPMDLADPESYASQSIRLDALTSFISLIYRRRGLVDGGDVFDHVKAACEEMLVPVSEDYLRRWTNHD